MTLSLDTLLEGSPSYGVLDAKDGVVLYRREGHEKAFDAIAAEAIESAGDEFAVIPISNDAERYDRLFIAPLSEAKSFAR